jgi:hypothetical protein
MGYFTYIADQAFREGDQGETLFFLGWPWSKPLVIESGERRKSVYSKHLWMQRIFLSILILGQPFLFVSIPDITDKVLGFVGYLAIVLAIQWLTQRVVFRLELRELKRRSKRLPLRNFYGQMAERHSAGGLFVGLIGCMLFVTGGIWMAFDASTGKQAIGIICSVFFGACGVGWGFALKLKYFTLNESEQGGDGNS